MVCGILNHFSDVFDDVQALENKYIQEYQCVNGKTRMISTSPVRLASQGVLEIGAPIRYAEHNAEVLHGIGYTNEEISAFKTQGVIFDD